MNNRLNRISPAVLINFGPVAGTAATATVGSAAPDLIAIG